MYVPSINSPTLHTIFHKVYGKQDFTFCTNSVESIIPVEFGILAIDEFIQRGLQSSKIKKFKNSEPSLPKLMFTSSVSTASTTIMIDK